RCSSRHRSVQSWFEEGCVIAESLFENSMAAARLERCRIIRAKSTTPPLRGTPPNQGGEFKREPATVRRSGVYRLCKEETKTWSPPSNGLQLFTQWPMLI